ncbi:MULTISPECIES: hypothetical protein [unclassified Mesorhizobium]|uniref:hypothetical protein n=1 Tax=unclassified Mesorhizobium TaxID=325217 RepID=UPI0003CEEB52|nr:hypothetical protein [Mesorhizobium sp. LSHC420B00]ESX80682.1 hypothetical protein X759_12185 [Mesorhizobium sp. LSHC420B00]
MATVSLDQKRRRVEISSFELANEVVFAFFNRLPAADRDEKLHRALYIGVLALMEDRLSSFLSQTANSLGTELESLKLIFDMKQELFYKSAAKGAHAEIEIADFLNDLIKSRRFEDTVHLTGSSTGLLPRNKTGDILCEIAGRPGARIAIECKFDKGIRLGDIRSKDVFSKSFDTAWSQLLETQANRDGQAGIIVLDATLADNSVLAEVNDLKFIPGVGFVVIVDSARGDYRNLAIAYALARDLVLRPKSDDIDLEILALIVSRTAKDLSDAAAIRSLVLSNIETAKAILARLEKSISLMEFNGRYLAKFMKDGTLSKQDLISFYSGEEVRERYRVVEQEIRALGT